MSGSQVLAWESKCEVIKQTYSDEVEARYSTEVKELVEEGRWEVGAETCWVVYCVAGDLLRKMIRGL